MTVASAADGDQRSDLLAALAVEVLAVGRRSWGAAWSPSVRVVAPGRIELLGNHLDYNGGKVLAAAIDRHILLLGATDASDGEVEVSFTDPQSSEHVLDKIDVASLADWQRDAAPETPTDYVRGAIAALLADGRPVRAPLRMAIGGNVPVGLGVSSSAALSVGLVMMLSTESLEPRQTILLAQAAENRAGVASGTMDQAASVAGGVIRYDAASVSFEQLAPDLDDLAFVVISSGVVHRLGESAYPARVREMGDLLTAAKRQFEDAALGHVAELTEVQVADLARSGAIDEAIETRVAHVISEVKRVDQGYDALTTSDWPRFGQLMTASGRSSATDYDISHPRVEELVAEVLEVDGVLGARMMGGGGGGSVLALVERGSIPNLSERLDSGYFSRHDLTGQSDLVLVCSFAGGARIDDLVQDS